MASRRRQTGRPCSLWCPRPIRRRYRNRPTFCSHERAVPDLERNVRGRSLPGTEETSACDDCSPRRRPVRKKLGRRRRRETLNFLPERRGSRWSISESIRDRRATRPPGHFHRNPLGWSQLAVFPRCSLDPESLLSTEFCSDAGILRPKNEPPMENCLRVATSGALSGVGLQDLMHSLDRHATLAYCGGAAFHRAGAHVARGEDAWAARLQRPRQTADAFPRGSVDDCVAGFYKALFIALDLERQPSGAWLGANHGKDGRRLHGSSFVRLRVLQLDSFENFPAHHFSDLGVR